jgi:addiction module HigA family antidote
MTNKDRLPPIHPGEILREEFLVPLGMPAHQLAMALRVPATRVNDIVNEKRGITADTALRLSRYFGTTSRFWMNMQASWELEVAEDRLGNAVRRDVLPPECMSGGSGTGLGLRPSMGPRSNLIAESRRNGTIRETQDLASMGFRHQSD